MRFLKFTAITLFMIGLSIQGHAQTTEGEIRGRVYDASTREVLPGATISLQGSSMGTVTENDGRFILRNLPEGDYMMYVSYVGYKTKEIELEVDDDE
ncbi:MAG: carboxypeptidase-like regulatory domain-containing protein, partial [Bacteroidota bacterium]